MFCFKQTSYELKVVLTGFEEQKGYVRIALVNSEETFLTENPLHTDIIPVLNDTITILFKHLSQGVYALQVFHDINSNEELDKNFLGAPSEPYVFSNHAKGFFGPPSFEDARFKLNDNKTIYLMLNEHD